MKKLGIYYGWPSCVRGLDGKDASIDNSVEVFSAFDILVLGAGLELASHPDYLKTKKIIGRLGDKEIFGDLPIHQGSVDEIVGKLKGFKELGMTGVLVNLIDPGFGAPDDKVSRIATAAHDMDLKVMYNAGYAGLNLEDWFDKRVTGNARERDYVLIAPFGTSYEQEFYPIPIMLPGNMSQLQESGVKIVGASTYPDKLSVRKEADRGVLLQRFLRYRGEAEHLGLDAYQLTNRNYGASGNDSPLLVDFSALER